MPDLAIPIIFNGVETDAFTPARTEDQRTNLLCVGRLIDRKGQQYLLRAFAELCKGDVRQNLWLTLVGTGDAEAALKRQAHQLGIEDRVEFAGFVSREQMPKIYRQAAIFVLPSQSEGMSIALLEAMSSGLPVVVTNTGGTDELVTAGVNGLVVDWADVGGLTAALRELIDQRDMREGMGRESRRVAQSLSWSEITSQYVDLVQSIVLGVHVASGVSERPAIQGG
jgi:glycosyltransferase involved in cell wall biosynthesis